MSIRDYYQNQRIAENQLDNLRNARQLEDSQEVLEELQKSVKQLSLVCKSLWELLLETSDLPEDALEDKLKQFQEESVEQSNTCLECGRIRQKRLPNCFYCGAAYTQQTPFNV